jgi:hypothetical protein
MGAVRGRRAVQGADTITARVMGRLDLISIPMGEALEVEVIIRVG